MIEGGDVVSSFAVLTSRAAVAGADCVGKEGRLERAAHEATVRRVREIGCAGGGVGEDVALDLAFAPYLFLHLWLDCVEGEILPAMPSLEMCQGEPVLQPSGHLIANRGMSVSDMLQKWKPNETPKGKVRGGVHVGGL